ncbi:MAG: hypothetical protein ABIR52_05165 [Casimicrobiaceae bacterium]
MATSVRATTLVEGNVVTLNVAAMTIGPPPPPPPPFRIALSRRGTVVTIKKGSIDITIDIPADGTRPVVVDARGRAVCRSGSATGAKAKPAAKKPAARPKRAAQPKRAARRGPPQATAAMTMPPPPDDKGA